MLFDTVQDGSELLVVVGSAMSNVTADGTVCGTDYGKYYFHSTIGVGILLVLSLCCNILFCASRCRSGNTTCQSKKKRVSSRQMEENPIYGNISYTVTSIESDAPHSRTQPRFNSDSRIVYIEGKPQECYANLTLKAPRVQSGRSSPQIQYSDIIQVEDPPQSEREDEGCAEGASIVSDLYASVQTQRVKAIDPAEDGEGYANHL